MDRRRLVAAAAAVCLGVGFAVNVVVAVALAVRGPITLREVRVSRVAVAPGGAVSQDEVTWRADPGRVEVVYDATRRLVGRGPLRPGAVVLEPGVRVDPGALPLLFDPELAQNAEADRVARRLDVTPRWASRAMDVEAGWIGVGYAAGWPALSMHGWTRDQPGPGGGPMRSESVGVVRSRSAWVMPFYPLWRGTLVNSVVFGAPVLAALLARRWWRRRARRREGLCPGCGYDLRGSPARVCPECGRGRVEVGATENAQGVRGNLNSDTGREGVGSGRGGAASV